MASPVSDSEPLRRGVGVCFLFRRRLLGAEILYVRAEKAFFSFKKKKKAVRPNFPDLSYHFPFIICGPYFLVSHCPATLCLDRVDRGDYNSPKPQRQGALRLGSSE